MAFVICSECGSKVSDKSAVCQQCGAPISAVASADCGFEAIDKRGKITSDCLSLIMGLLCFLFPVTGLAYAFWVKNDKPSAFPVAMITAICGLLMGMVFMLLADGLPFFIVLFGSFGAGGSFAILFMCLYLLAL